MAKQYIDWVELEKAINTFKPQRQLFEVRIIKDNRTNWSGYFKDFETLHRALEYQDLQDCNVYAIYNQLKEECFCRTQRERFVKNASATTDKEILRYNYFGIDLDPERTSKISSTKDELIAAINLSKEIKAYLEKLGFLAPITATSGNGMHLMYKISLENTKDNEELIRKCYKALSFIFESENRPIKVKIDLSTFNPAQLFKLYGTLAQKGADAPERPHRMSKIIDVPSKIETNDRNVLEKLALIFPEPEQTLNPNTGNYYSHRSDFDIQEWLTRYGYNYKTEKWRDCTKFVLDACPFDSSHTGKDAVVMRHPNGAISFKCLHDSCQDKKWQDFRLLKEPDAYEPKHAEKFDQVDKGKKQKRKNKKTASKSTTNNSLQAYKKEQMDALQIILNSLDVVNNYATNDKGSGALFADVFKEKHRYNPDVKDYMYFDGKRWQKDVEGMKARTAAKELVDALFQYIANAELEEQKKNDFFAFAYKLTNYKNRNTMLNDAKDENFFRNDDLDKDIYLLNCQNGILDLNDGDVKFIPHNANFLLSKISNAYYNPAAECPVWEKFLKDVMQSDKEKIRYLQKIVGISLTGNIKEETMFILYGATTRNGKSTFVETIIYLLKDYALTMRPESLAVKQNKDSRQANGDIARLKGVRFVNASEPPKKMIFDAALIKSLTGGDSITARHLHENEFEFTPAFKLVINTNYLPQIHDDTVFGSGRINVISFNRHFRPEERDRELKNRLKEKEELSGILNWCIEGLRLYESEGLTPPPVIVRETDDYRQQSDKVGNFINEMLVKSDKNIKAFDVYTTYQKWCEENGHGCENKTNFYAELKSKNIFADKGTVAGKTVKNIVRGYEFDFHEVNGCTPFD